ncbi:MAG: hypothetical protein ACFFDW_11295 [Candidatus Thorarchaeota archaeon]
MKKTKDDLGSTIDGEDNLARMILIEQAIDAAYEIDEDVSRSYAFCDCIIGIVEFARESNNEEVLQRIHPLLEEINNKGAYVRAQSAYSLVAASFGRIEESIQVLEEAIKNAQLIKDDFDKRDALLDLATSAADIALITDNSNLTELAMTLANELTKGQRAYLYGYLSTLKGEEDDESKSLMREAVSITDEITDPITRSKVFLELASLFSNEPSKYEMD